MLLDKCGATAGTLALSFDILSISHLSPSPGNVFVSHSTSHSTLKLGLCFLLKYWLTRAQSLRRRLLVKTWLPSVSAVPYHVKTPIDNNTFLIRCGALALLHEHFILLLKNSLNPRCASSTT